MTDEIERKLVGVVDRADTWLAEERDLAVVDAFNGFYHQLAAVNRALAELEELSRDRDVTALALARTNLEWDLLDGHLVFLAATSRNGSGVRRTPALGEAIARMRRTLARGLAFRPDSGTAGELLAQTHRLAERLATYESVTDDALAKAIDSRKAQPAPPTPWRWRNAMPQVRALLDVPTDEERPARARMIPLAAVAPRAWLMALAAMRRAISFVFGSVLRAPTRSRRRRAPVRVVERQRTVPPVAIPLPSSFSQQDYPALLEALRHPGAKLLDLSSVRVIRADLFTALASEWLPDPKRVPRIAIVLRFGRWALLRESAALRLAPLHARGVEAELFYAEQAYDGGVQRWFEHGEATHNAAAVLTTMRRCDPSPISPVVLDAVARLVYQAVANGAPTSLIIDLATVALASGANIKALSFAREALLHLGEVASIERLEALRVLGLALMSEGRVICATGILDGAVAMAIGLGKMEAGAELLRQLGADEFDRGETASAEKRFRTAIDLLRPTKSELLASLHHNLAIALIAQGTDGAEVHAAIALASRPDKHSPGAQMDMELLGNIRTGRGMAS